MRQLLYFNGNIEKPSLFCKQWRLVAQTLYYDSEVPDWHRKDKLKKAVVKFDSKYEAVDFWTEQSKLTERLVSLLSEPVIWETTFYRLVKVVPLSEHGWMVTYSFTDPSHGFLLQGEECSTFPTEEQARAFARKLAEHTNLKHEQAEFKKRELRFKKKAVEFHKHYASIRPRVFNPYPKQLS